MDLSPDGSLMFVANEDDNMVTVVDIASGQMLSEIPVGVEPEGIGVSHDGKWAVNTSETTNMAHFIDTDTHEITDNVLVDQRPRFAEWTSDDAEVWVSAEIGGTVSVIDNATRQIKHKITFEIPGVPKEAIQPVGRAGVQGPQVGVRGARPVEPGGGGRTRRPSRSRSICWSVSGSGSSPSARTRSSSTAPTASPTTSR